MIPQVIAVLAAGIYAACSPKFGVDDPVITDTWIGGKDAGKKPKPDAADESSTPDTSPPVDTSPKLDVPLTELPNPQDSYSPDTYVPDIFAKDSGDGVGPEIPPTPDVTTDTPTDIPTPPQFCKSKVLPPKSCNIASIAAGQTSTFVAMKDGSVRGWGKLLHLDGGSMTNLFFSATPKTVAGFQNIDQVSIRLHHLLARDTSGKVWAMGQNGNGQLCNGKSSQISGIGAAVDSATPIAVPGLTNIVNVAAGDFHSLFLDASGKLSGCGFNGQGELGLPPDPNKPEASAPNEVAQPTAIPLPQDSAAVHMGAGHLHSFAVQASGKATIWGDNVANQSGIAGAGAKVLNPTVVGEGFLKLAGGYGFTCFLTTACGVSCKGDKAPTDAATKSLNTISDIIAGGWNLVAISESGDAQVWGDNSSGQKGLGSSSATIDTPTPITGLGQIVMASVGFDHICVVTAGCEVYCAGANQANQLGDGTTTPSSTWSKVNGLQ